MSRYKILLPREQQDIVLASEEQTRAAVKQLLAVFKVPDGQYEMGRTKVFFKPGTLQRQAPTTGRTNSSQACLQFALHWGLLCHGGWWCCAVCNDQGIPFPQSI